MVAYIYTHVFIKNSTNGSETAISICNAVNNFPHFEHGESRPTANNNPARPLEKAEHSPSSELLP